ncbi:radical SAM protein [Streptomyces sp. CdTB01]|uniref:radical SAM protein n=1 Tax=Streptomyces sp. CdTB01 TaxID=1725411 RepID=UPI00073A9D37|nr:radical SAM protein [Streptomyces sp. CdTB01]ALV39165.1 hypothetical protein AS200_44425 [Streptomyces sp. CdTB01]
MSESEGARMREVLLKVVDACPCDCAFCDSNEMFNTRFARRTFELDTWTRITNDLIANGLEVAIITGGDPLSKRQVVIPLIRHLRAAGVFVSVNTSGAQFTSESLLTALLADYPDLLVFSIDSAHAGQHDESRIRPGLFDLIVATISRLKSAGDHPVAIRVVITNRNYTQIPEIIALFHGYGVDCMKFTHIEDDREGDYLLSVDQLRDFDVTVRPRILEVLQGCYFETDALRDDAVMKFTKLLSGNDVTFEQLARGEFSPALSGPTECEIIRRFSVIQSNGQVLPCCESEHHYDPVLGNLATTAASEIFSEKNRRYLKILRNRQSYCTRCTEPHNLQISFRSRMLTVQKR